MLGKSLLCSLHDVLTRKGIDDFMDLGGTVITHPTDATRKCLYIRRSPDSKVLAVGHLDHVMFTDTPKITPDGTKVKAPQLDDRLGVWIILALIHQHLPADMPYDIVLTDKEEIGQSTGVLFTPPEGKQYNWMFEWDRRGDDVVMYDYETPELKALLEADGFTVGRGSFTDICVMDRVGCAGFNFGTCYYQEHSANCHADIPKLLIQLRKFREFYMKHYNTHLLGNQKEASGTRGRRSNYLYEAPARKGYDNTDKKSPFTYAGPDPQYQSHLESQR